MRNTNRFYRALPSGLGDWVYGCIVDNGKDRCYIIQNHINQRIPVIQETIGQYVPCLDAFEGDILYGYDNSPESPRPKWYGTVTYIPDHSRIMVVDDIGDLYEVDDFQYDRVMGNVHQYKNIFREQLISINLVKSIVGDLDAIVSHDTAALLLNLSIPTYQTTIHIYSTADCNIPGVTVHKVDSLQDIPQLKVSGINITTPDQTLRDLLIESTDSEILLSALANHQSQDPKAHKDLINNLPQHLVDRYNEIAEDIFDFLED